MNDEDRHLGRQSHPVLHPTISAISGGFLCIGCCDILTSHAYLGRSRPLPAIITYHPTLWSVSLPPVTCRITSCPFRADAFLHKEGFIPTAFSC